MALLSSVMNIEIRMFSCHSRTIKKNGNATVFFFFVFFFVFFLQNRDEQTAGVFNHGCIGDIIGLLRRQEVFRFG